MLGVLKAGGAYVVLDPEYPASRIDFLLKDTNALAVITQSDFTGRTSDGNVRKVVLDELRDELSKESKDNRVRCDNLEDTVYCIYTSGSTGVPKGVLVKHRGLLNYVISIVKRIQFEERGTFALVSTLTADLGNTMVFPSLCVGGCLHVISKEAATDAMMISDYFRRNRIDYLKIVPSHLIALLNEDKRCKHTLPKKILVLGGEALQDDWIAKIRKIGKCRIFNHYGPTETTVGVSTYDVSQFREHDTLPTVPIGKPLSNTQFYVLDSSLAPVPVGVMGELFIGGDCLARGYLNRPDQTAERFIPNPFSQDKATRLYRTGDLVRWLPDGNVEFLGRVDDQVKVRGFRIELGEIQNLLLKHENIRDAFLLAKKKEDGLSHAIFAYIVPKDRSKELKAAQLNEYICDKLPEYMVPARYVFLDKMPLTPNGKIDRKALPEPESVSQDLEDTYVAPRTPEEKMLCDVWKRILKVEKVSIYDNFFELGGDSLIAIRATFKLKSLGIKGDVLRGIFSGKTIAEMAGEMASGEGAAKPKISKGIEETKKTSKIISIRESVNALRGIALLLLIFNHWAPGFSMRIFGGWHEKFYEIASKNLPGTVFFAFSFGIALGYAYWSLIVSGKDKQAMKLLRSRIPIILVALFLFSLPNYIRNFVNDKTTPTDWALAMSDILFYYFLAVLSSPLWFRIAAKTKRPVVACFMLAAGNELLAMLAHNLKLGSAFDHGWLLLFRDNLQGYYGYFDLTACVTAGLAFGIWLQGVAVNGGQKDGAIKRMLVIGAMLAAAGIFMGGLSVISSTGEYRIGLWQAVSYGGLSMLIVLLFSQMENMKEGVAGWMAKKGRGILSSIGLSTLAIFILHTYTIPVKGVLRSMGLTDTLSLLISVGAFLLGSYLVARLIHNLKAPI
jgi:amino acid adenylation domain-containing protein